MKSYEPTPELIAAMDDMKAVLAKHSHLSGLQMLAIASQLVGNLIALQDQTRVTSSMAMLLVSRNIEIGNLEAIAGVLDTRGQA